MKTDIHVLGTEQKYIEMASQVIKKGGIVVYPTESFYGIGADATNEKAVKKVFRIKGREEGKPILLIIGNMDMLYLLVEDIPDYALRLIENFWPGPLTILFRASKYVLSALTGGTDKIGIRMSGYPVARMLSELSGVPITGTSANLSGKAPCKSADEIIKELSGIDIILDAGTLSAQKPTTVVDVTVRPAKIIRKGLIPENMIRDVVGEIEYA